MRPREQREAGQHETSRADCGRLRSDRHREGLGKHGAIRPERELIIDPANGRILNLGIDTSRPVGELIFTIIVAVAQMERDLITERTKLALDTEGRGGERVGGRKPSHTPIQVMRAIDMMDTTTPTGQEIANAVGMSRSRMSALVARARVDLEAM